jgi:hypothetical protein
MKALSITALFAKRRNLLPFEGDFFRSFGAPELTGTWIIWGESGSGKTSMALQICKYLATFDNIRVAYNSLEEADGHSIKMAFQRAGLDQVKRRIILLPSEPIEELKERLRKQKSPNVVVIDSLQYSGMTYSEYKSLRDEFKTKLFIIISHAEGKNPAGSMAKKVRYDAFIKIRVEGYKAFIASRYGGGEAFTISDELASQYWGIQEASNS